jgi:hypothetical protein
MMSFLMVMLSAVKADDATSRSSLVINNYKKKSEKGTRGARKRGARKRGGVGRVSIKKHL